MQLPLAILLSPAIADCDFLRSVKSSGLLEFLDSLVPWSPGSLDN